MSIIPQQEQTKARLRVSLKRRIRSLMLPEELPENLSQWPSEALIQFYKYLKIAKGA